MMDTKELKAPGEIWRSTHDPRYEVSNLGRVRSLDHEIMGNGHGGTRISRGKILKPSINHNGYPMVTISGNGKRSVHRMVALAFIPPVEGKNQVNHISGVKTDSSVANLEWVTGSENRLHAFKVLGIKKVCQGKFGADHPASKPVIATNIKTGESKYYACASDAIREIGANSGCIGMCCNNVRKKHKGHYWKFAEKMQTSGVSA